MPLLFGLVWSVDGSMNSKNLETDFIYLFLSLFYSSPDKPKYMIRKATQVDMKPPWRKPEHRNLLNLWHSSLERTLLSFGEDSTLNSSQPYYLAII